MSIIIGDIHGESYWKDILKNNWNKKDHVFFICSNHVQSESSLEMNRHIQQSITFAF